VREGLVRFDPRRGFSVRIFQAQDVEEIYAVRGALEVLALRLAAPRLDRAEIEARLEELYRLRAHWQESPVALLLQSDIRLHNLLIHHSGNRLLIRTLAELRSQVSIFQYRDTSIPQRNRIALDDHERILLALLGSKTELAAAYMAQHIENAKNGVLADFFDSHHAGEAGAGLPHPARGHDDALDA
jgi:DNA-binding GntR family transcriptional regulator